MDFEKLVVWQRSKCLAVGIYREFAQCRDLGFKDQITRSALSVPSNIAYIAQPLADNWIAETRELSKMLCGLINKISD